MSVTTLSRWRGISQATYEFAVYPANSTIPSGYHGVYIYSRDGVNAIYIGEGHFCDRCCPGHHKARCIAAKGATQLHLMVVSDERRRKAIESDLLAYNTEAYAPTGCNEKFGG